MVVRRLEQRQRRAREPLELVERRARARTASGASAATTRASASPARRRRRALARPRARRSPRLARVGSHSARADRARGGRRAESAGSARAHARAARAAARRRRARAPAGRRRRAARRPARRARRRGCPSSSCSGRPARGGSRGSRPARRGRRRAPRASRRSARAARRGRLRQRVVGGVADQQVAEAEGVLAGELAVSGRIELLAHERGQPRRDLRLLGSERLDGAAVEDLALDRAALEHAPLRLLELVEPRGEQRPQRGGTATSPSPPRAIATISVRKSGLPPAARAIRSRSSSGQRRREQLVDLVVRQAARAGASTGHAGRRSSSSGRAMQRSRSGAPRESSATLLDQVEERLLAPLDVVEDARRAARLLLEQLAERPGDLLGGRAPRRSRRAASGSAPPRPGPTGARPAA